MHNIEEIINVLKDYNAFEIKEYANPVNWIPYGIVCTATSERSAFSLVEKICQLKFDEKPYIEDTSSNWLIIEYSFCMIHIFQEETREYYSLDELWKKRGEK